jgi:hypothetical protein
VDDRRPISLFERVRSERRSGIAFAIGIGAALAGLYALVAPTWALPALISIPILVALREYFDLERTIRRAWRSALATVPANIDRAVTLRGIARPAEQRVVAPYSLRECLAYRARFTGARFVRPGETQTGDEQRERIADLIVEVGDAKILVEGDAAHLVCDPRAGEGAPLRGDDADVFAPMTKTLAARERHQELVLQPGDEIVIDGYLVAERQPRVTHRLVGGRLVMSSAADATPRELDELVKVRARPYRPAG